MSFYVRFGSSYCNLTDNLDAKEQKMPKITVDKFHDKEAVLDADSPEDSDFLHKLEVNELSRNSVCIGFISKIDSYHCHTVILPVSYHEIEIKYAMFY